jgi:tetratricopeptide (TPR) repeat protein
MESRAKATRRAAVLARPGLVLLFLVLAAGVVRAQDIALRAQVDRNSITLDEQIQLDVTVEGRFRSIEEPQRPPLDDFDVYSRGRSQSVQIVNGEFSAANTFTYVLVPKREGTFTIGAFVLQTGGKQLKTEPITVTVGGGPGVRGAPEPAAGAPAEREDRDVFVLARVDKQNAFVNEQILYTFYLYRAVQLTNLNYQSPTFQGFWVEKLKDSEKQYFKMINGRRYSVTELSTAIFPTTSGTLTIEPATLQLVILTTPFGFSLFDRGTERVLRTRPIEVGVSALPPAGKPAIFEGAVGEALQLDARLDRDTVEEGEPVTLTVQVEGTGNVKTFSKPRLPDLPEFKTYDSDSKTDVQALDRVSGSRTYEIVLVPKDEGEHVIPPIRMAYFDTREARYRTLETKPLVVTAARSSNPQVVAAEDVPQQQDIRILGRDIAHIRTDVAVSDQATPLYRRGVFAALAPVPLLAVLGAALVRRRRERLASDVALARASRARKQARRRLATADAHLKAGRGEAFYAEVSRALLQYAGDKLNVAPAGLTHEMLRARLAAAGVAEATCQRVVALLERCDAARFAPGSYGGERLREVLGEAEGLLVEIEDGWRRRASRAAGAAATVMLVLVLGCGAALPARAQGELGTETIHSAPDYAPPSTLLQRGHAAYENGRFDAAIAAYRQAEQAGVRNGGLYYDLGNAYYKYGDLGQAVACYRRAEMLMPRDAQLRSNLEFVLSRREDKAIQPADLWLVAQARRAFRWLSLNEWLAVCAALYVATCTLVVLRLTLGGGRALHGATWACGALLVVAMAVTAVKVHAVRGVQRGVVSPSRISVMSGPGADYTAEFSLHEGAEVRIEVQRPDWLRISVGRQLRGWVPAESIIPI